jgi:hypothetical protein
MFDVDARAEALEPPQIKVGGKTYTGKLLSAPRVASLLGRFDAMQGEEVPLSDVAGLLNEVFAAADFPPEVADSVPLALAEAVLEDFFECQVAAMEKAANRKTRRATKSTNSSGQRTAQK